MGEIVFKTVTELTLRNGEKLHVTQAEGNSARQAKASSQSKSIVFPSIRSRMIDSSFIVDIQDKTVEDPDATRLLAEQETKRNLISVGLLEPKENSKYGKGYLKYIVACIKLRKKSGKGISDIKNKLDEKQVQLVTDLLAEEALEW